MSDGETTLADQQGRFAQVVLDGEKVPDLEWQAGRLVLSNKRLVLASSAGKKTLALSKVRGITGRQDVNQTLAEVSSYLSLQVGADVILVSPQDQAGFEQALFGAILDQQVVLARHPAKEGGVVQDTGWEKGRLNIEDREVDLAIATGRFVEIDIDDVGTVREVDQTVQGEDRRVLEVEHTEAATAVQTNITGTRRHVAVLASLLRKGEAQNTTDVELSDEENEVLMALYSGVSPFQIPEFTGMDVETVEETYAGLREAGILEAVRTRREVSLKARGRHIASEAMGEE